MRDINQEEVLGKAYDSKLMARLLSYAKPYWTWLLTCILVVVIIAGIDLAGPYLIKIAIDDYINVYDKPIEVYHQAPENKSAILFEDRYYVIQKNMEAVNQSSSMEIAQLIKYGQDIFLIDGYVDLQSSEFEILETNGEFILDLKNEDRSFHGRKLTLEEIQSFRKEDVLSIRKIAFIYFLLVIIGFLLNYAQTYLLNYTSNKIVLNIRQELFTHLEGMSLSFFDKNPVGRLVTRVTNDTETLQEMYSQVLITMFKDLFILLGVVIIMVRMNVQLALLSFIVIPLILLATAIFRIKIREIYREVRIKLAQINSTLNENFTGMKTVHIFKREKQQAQQFDTFNREYLEANKKEIFIFSIFRPSMEVLKSMGIAIIIWYGGGNVIRGSLQFGVLVAFIDYIKQFFQPINDLTEKYNILQSAMASSERIFALLDKEADIENPDHPVQIESLQGTIEFKNVWFAYNHEDWVLKNINFKINAGESVAFVGATGAGKSSIINLMNRFYDIQKGEILIDGINIKDIPLSTLRKNIGVVLQDVFMFTGTIKDNILLNNTEISTEKMKEIAQYVNAHNFIEKLPNQYDEPVMERGSTLSSGQRQLLAFARALATDPSILVLDEATSNIDTETEELIQDAVVKLIQGRTSIAIAHRLSTIQNCNKIMVLHKGQLREMGSHQELLEMEGIYYKLYQLQYKESL